jgi:hypothetical protein
VRLSCVVPLGRGLTTPRCRKERPIIAADRWANSRFDYIAPRRDLNVTQACVGVVSGVFSASFYLRGESVPGENDPTGIADALERIAALETELAAQRRQFEWQIAIMQRALGNVIEFLKTTASKDDIEQVREGIVTASEVVRVNVADVIAAAVRKVANGQSPPAR